MATCIELAGAEYPKEYKGNKIIPLSGRSLLPLLKGEKESIHTEPLFWEHEGNKAVRMGNYKLVSKWQQGSEYNWELFDLKKDGTEMHDLSANMPKKVKEMSDTYNDWAEKNNVLPWDVQALYKKKRSNN
jgi:arylsulfatase A-like enzyme